MKTNSNGNSKTSLRFIGLLIVCGVIVIALIGFFVINFINKPRKSPYVNLGFYRTAPNDALIDSFDKELSALITQNGYDFGIRITNFENGALSSAASIKFNLFLAAKELDITMGYFGNMYSLAVKGAFVDLTDILAEAGLDIPEVDILKAKSELSNGGESLPYAIRLHDSELIRKENPWDEDYFIALLSDSTGHEYAVSLFKAILFSD